jgi:hypothetical protein
MRDRVDETESVVAVGLLLDVLVFARDAKAERDGVGIEPFEGRPAR